MSSFSNDDEFWEQPSIYSFSALSDELSRSRFDRRKDGRMSLFMFAINQQARRFCKESSLDQRLLARLLREKLRASCILFTVDIDILAAILPDFCTPMRVSFAERFISHTNFRLKEIQSGSSNAVLSIGAAIQVRGERPIVTVWRALLALQEARAVNWGQFVGNVDAPLSGFDRFCINSLQCKMPLPRLHFRKPSYIYENY